jgi:dolichol kinase
MEMLLWTMQWIVSLAFVLLGFGWFLSAAFKENWLFAIFTIAFPPFLLWFVPVHWSKYRLKYPIMIIVGGLILAALLQRARLGYWDWPDVEQST